MLEPSEKWTFNEIYHSLLLPTLQTLQTEITGEQATQTGLTIRECLLVLA